MAGFSQYIIPWTISQVAGLLILLAAWKKPVWTRYIFAFLFLAAGIFNWFTSMRTPGAYLMYAETAVPLYRDFISGWFSNHIRVVIPVIATGQLAIGLMMLAGGSWQALGCLGIMVFLLAIAPLGVGSAFPFSIVVSVAAYLVYRHWQQRWGANDEEVGMNLPGDDIVTGADFIATRGITVRAQPNEIFPWIMQIGSGRAGWYSIDWIDNGGRKSSGEILPQFQQIEKDQFIPFTPDGKNGMWVEDYIPDRHILWTDKAGKASWCWYLVPVSEKETRLITRLRTRYNWKSLWILYYLLYDAGDIIMMSRCMKGIKQRAENINL